MIVYSLSQMVYSQLLYSFDILDSNSDTIPFGQKLAVQISTYLLNATFNYAHWVFAFNYWALSLKLKLLTLQKPADTYSFPVSIVNWSVTAYTLLVPLIGVILKLV